MKVLVACEFSGIVRDAFAARGHDAWSCDILPSERNGQHIQDDVLKHLDEGWDLMVGHPECTFLTNAANAWLIKPCKTGTPEQRIQKREKAIQFFRALQTANIPKIALENPIPHPYVLSKVGNFQQKLQPWEFGEPYSKAICLWLKNLPPLICSLIETTREQRCWKEPPGPERQKNRSRFYTGIARAMAQQWG